MYLDLINPALSEQQICKDISGGKEGILGEEKNNSKMLKFPFFFLNCKMKLRFEITTCSFFDVTITVIMKAVPAH